MKNAYCLSEASLRKQRGYHCLAVVFHIVFSISWADLVVLASRYACRILWQAISFCKTLHTNY